MRIKTTLFIVILSAAITEASAQHYSLYNSGTIAESVENPWVSVFDGTCKKIGTNFFIPSVQGDGFLSGDADRIARDWGLRDIAMSQPLSNPQEKNRGYVYSHVNWLTVKVNLELDRYKNTEVLFNHATRAIGGGNIKNIAVNLGNGAFFNEIYDDWREVGVLNSKAMGFSFNETSLGLRTGFDDYFSAGVKLSYLSGIAHEDYEINHSELIYDAATDVLETRLRGYMNTARPRNDDEIGVQDFLPNFRNPGISLSAGIENWVNESFKFSLAIKDLGFIRWKDYKPEQLNVGKTVEIPNYSLFSIQDAEPQYDEIREDAVPGPYTTTLPMRLEAGGTALLHENYTANLVLAHFTKINRTDITLVNDFSYKDFHLIVNAGYNTGNNLSLGATFLISSPTVDFFIGSENLFPTARFIRYMNDEGEPDPNNPGGKTYDYNYSSSTAANVLVGFALKLGQCNSPHNSRWLNLRNKRGRRKKEDCYVF